MLLEDFGPDGKKQGATGEARYPLVFPADDSKWHLKMATVRFHTGFLDAIEIEGRPLDCPKGPYGPSVTIHVCGNLKTDAYGRTGDIYRMRWADGLLIENQRVLTGVEII